jgi:glyoxylase-like metal-dependent hydrolase (beta-lactamase superfamily II)
MGSTIKVHRFQASLFPVNAYLVETEEAVIAVDATLGVSDGRALAGRVGPASWSHTVTRTTTARLPPFADAAVPVYAVEGVQRMTRRDDAEKESNLRPMFGDEWARVRQFPNRVVHDGERLTAGGATFWVVDAGPSESRHDSCWILEGEGPTRVFTGDLVYSHMHAYLADGFHEAWLADLEKAKRDFPQDVQLYVGHGKPTEGHALLNWQAEYIKRLLEVLRASVERERLQGDALAEARLSVEPLREPRTESPRRR